MITWLPLGVAVSAIAAMADDPIVTDRPDLTESAVVVPLSRWQMETGLTLERSEGRRSLVAPEALLRYGFETDWEWRLGLPNHVELRDSGNSTRGWSDLYVGVKKHFGTTPSGVDVGLIVAAFLPTGSRGLRAEAVNPELKLCLAKDLSDSWSVAGMAYVAWLEEAGRRRTETQTTLSFGHTLSGTLSAFLEYAGTFGNGMRPEHVGHAGVVFRTSPDVQWDVHVGASLLSKPDRAFVAAGYSKRF